MKILQPRWRCCPGLLVLLAASVSLGGYGCAQQSGAARGASDAAMLQAGEAVFYQCAACHTVTQGGASLMGPNLRGVFGSQAGTRAGFGYSRALTASAVVWTEITMDQYLTKPAAFIPATTMAFVGLPRAEDRAALIAYLKTATAD